MPHDFLFSATEILNMHISGLPTSKSKLLAKAAKENWYSELKTGLGGVRKVFEIPEIYRRDKTESQQDTKSEFMNQLYSAADIAELKITGLPTTKKAILTRAEKEQWYEETRIGLGGKSKVFKIPEKYLSSKTIDFTLINRLYTAAEIASMNVPGLPTSKPNILARAKNENWYFETRTGVGGRRKVFQIPAHYFSHSVIPLLNSQSALGSVKPENDQIDSKRLTLALTHVEQFYKEQGSTITPTRKSEIVVILYHYMKGNSDSTEVQNFLKLLMKL